MRRRRRRKKKKVEGIIREEREGAGGRRERHRDAKVLFSSRCDCVPQLCEVPCARRPWTSDVRMLVAGVSAPLYCQSSAVRAVSSPVQQGRGIPRRRIRAAAVKGASALLFCMAPSDLSLYVALTSQSVVSQVGGTHHNWPRQKWQASYFRSQAMQCGVRCPAAQRSPGHRSAAKHSRSPNEPVTRPQSTQGRLNVAGSPCAKTVNGTRPGAARQAISSGARADA